MEEIFNERAPVLAVDFDGTLVENEWPEIGDFKEGAEDAIKELKDAGWTLVLWTCRSGEDLEKVKDYLEEKELEFDYYNNNTGVLIEFFGGDCRKVSADYYIDDKTLLGPEINWGVFKKELLSIYDERN